MSSKKTNLLQHKTPTVEKRSILQDHSNMLSKESNLLQHKKPTVEISNNLDSFQNSEYNLSDIKEGLKDIPKKIETLLALESRIEEPRFHFIVSRDKAKENFKILKDEKFNLKKILNEKHSITSYGSEFKDTEMLKVLLGKHPRWSVLENQLKNRVSFPIKKLEKQTCLQDLVGALK